MPTAAFHRLQKRLDPSPLSSLSNAIRVIAAALRTTGAQYWRHAPDPAGDARTRRAVVPIVAGSLNQGRLVAFSAERELTGDDVHNLERAAIVASLAITNAHAVSAVESNYLVAQMRDI